MDHKDSLDREDKEEMAAKELWEEVWVWVEMAMVMQSPLMGLDKEEAMDSGVGMDRIDLEDKEWEETMEDKALVKMVKDFHKETKWEEALEEEGWVRWVLPQWVHLQWADLPWVHNHKCQEASVVEE